MLTRKDYVLIAQKLDAKRPVLDAFDSDAEHGFRLAVEAVAEAFAADNPRFDRARFLTAAGVEA